MIFLNPFSQILMTSLTVIKNFVIKIKKLNTVNPRPVVNMKTMLTAPHEDIDKTFE